MPLLDHFHPPLSARRRWEGFHAAWAAGIMRTLNRRVLPEGCFAETQVHLGGRVEIDVATWNDQTREQGGGVAVQPWSPPAAALVMPCLFPDEIEVQVFDQSEGPTLVAAIELVSPRNKDRPEARRAFCAMCASYLHQGIGLVIVDIVTPRLANLRNELVRLMQQVATFEMADSPGLYVVAYRPRRSDDLDLIDLWPTALQLGQPLPTVPLALRNLTVVPLDLEGTYAATCADSRF